MTRKRFAPASLLCALCLAAAPTLAEDPAGTLEDRLAPGGRSPRWLRPDLPRPKPEAAPRRVISLAPVVTEALFALGLGERVAAVTRYCDRPAEAAMLPKVGGFVDPQVEAVLALKPDLVVAMPSLGQRAALERIREQGVPVLIVFGDTLEEVKALIAAVADATGANAAGTAQVAALEAALAKVASSTPTTSKLPRVVIVFQVEPLVVAGPRTFADEVIPIAGGKPAVPRNAPAWPTWSLEALLFLRPDVLVAAEGDEARARLERLLQRVRQQRQGMRVVSAGRPLLMRPGPHLAEDVAALAGLLHPKEPSAP